MLTDERKLDLWKAGDFDDSTQGRVIRFANAIEAEVRAEAHDEFDQCSTMLNDAEREIEALQAEVAQQSAEIERLKTVPMKYRRMAFNAELQESNKQQAERIAELEKFQEDAFVAHPNLDLDIEALTQKGNQNVSN